MGCKSSQCDACCCLMLAVSDLNTKFTLPCIEWVLCHPRPGPLQCCSAEPSPGNWKHKSCQIMQVTLVIHWQRTSPLAIFILVIFLFSGLWVVQWKCLGLFRGFSMWFSAVMGWSYAKTVPLLLSIYRLITSVFFFNVGHVILVYAPYWMARLRYPTHCTLLNVALSFVVFLISFYLCDSNSYEMVISRLAFGCSNRQGKKKVGHSTDFQKMSICSEHIITLSPLQCISCYWYTQVL